MSVTDLPPHEQEFERTPPHDVAAEQCVLGGMLLSQDAIADVIESLRTTDFYRPAHQIIFDTILDLYGRGEPADAITVAAALTTKGEITRVGGAPYLHTLMSSVPTAANAGYYAKIVQERAVLRKLVEVGTRIVQRGYQADGSDADAILDWAEAEVLAIGEKRTGEDYSPLSEIMPGALDEIEAIGSRGGQMTGVPTGFADLDALTNGLHPGQMVIIAARPAIGKALHVDTPLPTPTGWTTMGDVAVGEYLLGADGRPTRVVAATEVMQGRPCFQVEFSDGSVIVADADHQWRVTRRTGVVDGDWARSPDLVGAVGTALRGDRGEGSALLTERGSVVGCGGNAGSLASVVITTKEIARALGGADFVVEAARAFELPAADLPDDPYVVGLTVGRRGEAYRGIPRAYLRASQGQRLTLLEGILDAAGVGLPDGRVRYVAPDGELAESVAELVISLGWQASVTSTQGLEFRVEFAPDRPVLRGAAVQRGAQRSRRIVAVRPVESVPVRCVQVDNGDHMYLAGRACVPTHNSTLALDFARAAAIKHGLTAAFFSLEMGRNEITMRLLSAEARVALHAMRSGTMQDEDWTRLARRMSEVAEAPLFIDDSPNMSMMEIRAKCRRLKQQHDLRLVIIDYLQLMSSGKRAESRQVEVSEFSRSLKLLAKELGVPVIALSQLNRGPEQRTDKKPMVSDLRESGCLTPATRVLRADTNQEITLGELFRSGARDIPVWALDERLKYVPRTMTHAFSSGRKEVFQLTLASGKQIEATANHPFLTLDGWKQLGDLRQGEQIAVPRHVPPPLNVVPQEPAEVVRLADLASDASSGLAACVPLPVFALPKEQIALFLRRLWESGHFSWETGQQRCRLEYVASSRRLVEDISRLLLRFGIMSRQERCGAFQRLHIDDVPNQIAFLAVIGVEGSRREVADQAIEALRSRQNDAARDADSSRVWKDVRSVMLDADGGQRLGAVVGVLEDFSLEIMATNDVHWDEISSVASVGVQEVYDATVMGLHNFVADGITVKNSIEQDADVVILLHREDAYEKESPRAGEADLIVAKHRNGPTATVTVAFQGHYSRFVDMATG